jgi:ABC-type nitrate/sulfonate/bicarbonate transport system substrate-binding protein
VAQNPLTNRGVSVSIPAPPIRIGFVPLLDAAPLIAAQELGIFHEAGLDVRLKSEPGWATIHDKFVFGELDVVQSLAGQALELRAGRSINVTGFAVPLFLNRGGSCIVLSKAWIDQGVTTAREMLSISRASNSGRKLTFGAVHRLSSHGFLLQKWTEQGNVKEGEVQFVNLPPSLLARNVHLGHLDGICVGEPWSTHCSLQDWGAIVATGESLAPNHPDKVLIVSRYLRQQRQEETIKLLRCIIQAADWCDKTVNHPHLASMLASEGYIGLAQEVIAQALAGKYPLISGGNASRIRFDSAALRPTGSRLTWLAEQWRKNAWNGTDQLPQFLDSELFASAIDQP